MSNQNLDIGSGGTGSKPDTSKIYMSEGFDVVNYFNPYRINMENNDVYIKGIPYIFMTCPVLNISENNLKSSDFMGYLRNSDQGKKILGSLSNPWYSSDIPDDIGSTVTGKMKLVPMITNLAQSIDIKDTAARTKEVGETLYGYKQVYPGSTVDSIVGDEISIKYIEMSDIPIIKFHKAWLEYIEGVRRGKFLASKHALDNGYIDFLVSIYYFLCDFDGETLRYWAKYTGCAPLIVPYSSFGGEFNSHTIPDFTINYSYCHKADLDFSILRDFNRVSDDDNSNTSNNGLTNLNYKAVKDSDSDSMIDKKPRAMGYSLDGAYSGPYDRGLAGLRNDPTRNKNTFTPRVVNDGKTLKLQFK